MSFVSRLINPNPPLTAAQVQAAVAAALTAQPASEKTTVGLIQRGSVTTTLSSTQVTIIAIDVSKASINLLTSYGAYAHYRGSGQVVAPTIARTYLRIQLLNSTTIQIDGIAGAVVNYEVLERL